MPTAPMLPPGLRIYAVGDVHGRFDLLSEMACLIEADLRASRPERAIEIFLGDYVDRGPQTREVIDWLMDTQPVTDERICLYGNHEDMMLKALDQPSAMPVWEVNGGDATLASYGVAVPPVSPAAANDAFVAAFPQRHLQFLSALPRRVEFGSYLFVHAGIDPDRPLDDQDPNDLIWIREKFHRSEADFGRIVVHGHTPVREPEFRPNRINIDTGAVFRGRLTCVVLEGTARRVIEAREPGA